MKLEALEPAMLRSPQQQVETVNPGRITMTLPTTPPAPGPYKGVAPRLTLGKYHATNGCPAPRLLEQASKAIV
jgi:hypothetical protein